MSVVEAATAPRCRLAYATVLLVLGVHAEARVTRILIDLRSPAFANQAFGPVGPYEVLRGRVFGEITPEDPHNTIIQDIALAPRNDRGHVEYISTFTLLKPIDASKVNGVLFYEVPNRGTSLHWLFSGGDPGDGFFYQRGYTILSAGWQGNLTPTPAADRPTTATQLESIAVPRAKNPDGSVITGPFLVRIPHAGSKGPTGNLARLDQGPMGQFTYSPASFDTAQASLSRGLAETVRGTSRGRREWVARSDWAWANCQTGTAAETTTLPSNLCIKLLKGVFDPKQVYTLKFTVQDPRVLGLGLAATRDVVSFFRYSAYDDSGNANPIFGTVPHAIGQGISQTSRFVRALIDLGFNEDEAGRIVWDGVNTHIGGRILPVNLRFANLGTVAGLYEPSLDGILWWGSAPDRVRHKAAASLLDRCQSTNTCPKIFETFGGNELWYGGMSVGLAGTDGSRDIPLPPNVRRYYFPGTSHGGGEGGFSTRAKTPSEEANPCRLPPNPNPETETMRALLVALTGWVAKDIPPPDSRYPTLQEGSLTAASKGSLKFPTIPGILTPDDLASPLFDYDFGPNLNTNDLSGYIDHQPPIIRNVVRTLVSTVDADGNEQSGIPSVLHAAPLGTYLGWNITRTGVYAGQICTLAGSFVPFTNTRADRLKRGDPRRSIEERYGDRQGYVCAVKNAAHRSVKERFLLEEDVRRLIDQAVTATSSGDLASLPDTPTARGRALCVGEN